jgi:ABC-type multidrug transport system permease subunit
MGNFIRLGAPSQPVSKGSPEGLWRKPLSYFSEGLAKIFSGDVPFKVQSLQAAQKEVRMMLQVLAECGPQIRQSIEQHLERDPALIPRQRRSNTEMDTEAERHVIA